MMSLKGGNEIFIDRMVVIEEINRNVSKLNKLLQFIILE